MIVERKLITFFVGEQAHMKKALKFLSVKNFRALSFKGLYSWFMSIAMRQAAPIYQILIRLSLSRYIISPGFTLKAV
jgi:hypothetical protein